MILPIFANLDDIERLKDLEDRHLMPAGTTAMAAKQAMAYLLRIVELKESSHGQRQPKIYTSSLG